ncbi:MAG TPA: hypothetical protein V6C50_05595, partial [Crinalium sp.]
YGILVQLRLEEIVQGNQLAATARQQLLKFYSAIGLPQTLYDLGLGAISIADLQQAADIACANSSDIHRLPFAVEPSQLMAAMVSTTADVRREERGERREQPAPLPATPHSLPLTPNSTNEVTA